MLTFPAVLDGCFDRQTTWIEEDEDEEEDQNEDENPCREPG